MRSRWILNLLLLAAVAGIALFIYTRPEKVETGPVKYPISSVQPSSITQVTIEFPAKAPIVLNKENGRWMLARPYRGRANNTFANELLRLLNAESLEKFPAADLGRFGLDKPSLKLSLGEEVFTFGTFNPLTNEQYLAHKDAIYLVPHTFSEMAGTQVTEMLDKRLVAAEDRIAGFDFSRLEQWEKTGLKVEQDEAGVWQVSAKEAKPDQQMLNEWFDEFWGNASAKTVEPYTADRRAEYPSFKVKLKDGRVIHFDKIQEAPELLLARPDEGLLYHVAPDVGFSLLNPPVGFKPE